jgi:hypothetical protein
MRLWLEQSSVRSDSKAIVAARGRMVARYKYCRRRSKLFVRPDDLHCVQSFLASVLRMDPDPDRLRYTSSEGTP